MASETKEGGRTVGLAAPAPGAQSAPHTPGPWVIADEHPDGVLDRSIKADGFYVATVHDATSHDGCWDADARLIAAAPDLLQALQAVPQDSEWSCMARDVQDAVLAAIAKATGQ